MADEAAAERDNRTRWLSVLGRGKPGTALLLAFVFGLAVLGLRVRRHGGQSDKQDDYGAPHGVTVSHPDTPDQTERVFDV